MTIKERIADWISGGAITMWRDSWAFEADDKLHWIELAAKRRDALNDIIAQEKPTSNATVRRMARIAREALE